MSDDNISMPISNDAGQPGSQQNAGQNEVVEAIDEEIDQHDVVLYMKGSPADPMCGFSARAANILQAYGVDFHHVDVLTETGKREAIKEYGDWPTIPQLYVGGELVGGSDIMVEMYESGELAETLKDEGLEVRGG
jgi:monothiol glutaredoxin